MTIDLLSSDVSEKVAVITSNIMDEKWLRRYSLSDEINNIGCSLLSSGETWYREPAIPFRLASVYKINGLLKSGWIRTGALERADFSFSKAWRISGR
jgi:hypothetical protein